MSRKYFHKLIAYDHWANAQCLASLQSVKGTPGRTGLLFSHIVETEYLWFQRLHNFGTMTSVWNGWPLDGMPGRLDDLLERWKGYVDTLGDHDLTRVVSYVNTKGLPYENTVEDILIHVIHHSTYHRGQIALAVRQLGGEPAVTDYAAFFR